MSFLDKIFQDIDNGVDDFIDAVNKARISRKIDDIKENFTLSEEEKKFKKKFNEWEKEEYGPRAETTVFKELKKKRKKRNREKFDQVVDPDSTVGQGVHRVRRTIDREKEKMENRTKAPRNLFYSERVRERFNLADHLFIRVGPITHHGIYVGHGYVIHYAPSPAHAIGEIHEVTLEEFAHGKRIQCLNRKSPLAYPADEVVRRAYSRVGEYGYDLFGNNCEFFVRWCRCGGDEDVWKRD